MTEDREELFQEEIRRQSGVCFSLDTRATMIKLDISNVLPKRLWTYSLGLIPGLLFELSSLSPNLAWLI